MHKFKIVRVNSVELLHEIGHISEHRFIFWRVHVKNHNSFRKYYIARNTLYLARKRKSPFHLFKAYLQVAKQFLWVILYEEDKIKKLKEIYRGYKDGLNAQIDSLWWY